MNDYRKLNVCLYMRVSTEDQAKEGYSLDAQLQKLRLYCKSKDWNIVDEYTDDGYSGRDTKRPKYQEMMKNLHRIDGILVLKMDRIHRNSMNFMEMMDYLKRKDKNFISMTEDLNTSTAMGRFFMDLLQRVAQLESEQTGERTYIGMEQKQRDLEAIGWNGGRPPFGYKLKKIKSGDKFITIFEPDSLKLEVVKKIFEQYSNGFSIPAIASMLHYNYWTVRYILQNPIYVGYLKWSNIIKKIDIEPVINKTLWNIVQRRKSEEADRGDYKPLILNGEDIIEIPVEKIKKISAVHKPKHMLYC